MQEIWKTVITEDGIYENYQVSNLGRIKSLNYHREKREKILTPYKDKKGYLHINIYKDGKRKLYQVHRLVAYAFIPNPNNLPFINHRDEYPSNNCITNLEWCDAKYNSNYGTIKERKSESFKGEKHPMYGKHHSEETKIKIKESLGNQKGSANYNSKKIICIETGEVFEYMGEVKKIGIPCSTVSACCKGRLKQAHGLTFRYLDQVLFYN